LVQNIITVSIRGRLDVRINKIILLLDRAIVTFLTGRDCHLSRLIIDVVGKRRY
jgi:hypothetical protein